MVVRLRDDPTRERWERAQVAELEWWQNWLSLPFYKNHSFPEYWKSVVSGLMGDVAAGFAGTIVEVGCGPHGIVRYLFQNAKLKLGFDPLLCRFGERPSSDARTGYAAAIGEKLPLRDEAADLVFCINVLDHVMDARQILREIRRILKPGGKLVLEVHTFPRALTPMMFFDHPHTFHWSRRDVAEMVKDEGYTVLRVQTRGFPVELAWSSLFKPSHWKYVFGRLFLKLSYVYCQK